MFDGGAIVPADVFLDAFTAPGAALPGFSLKELVERRIALAIKAHRFRSLNTVDTKEGLVHCKACKQRAYEKRLKELDAAIAQHARQR